VKFIFPLLCFIAFANLFADSCLNSENGIQRQLYIRVFPMDVENYEKFIKFSKINTGNTVFTEVMYDEISNECDIEQFTEDNSIFVFLVNPAIIEKIGNDTKMKEAEVFVHKNRDTRLFFINLL